MQIAVRARTQSLEVVICALLASAFAFVAVVVAPAGGDLAAHLYRTSLVQHGVLIWDNLWFAGQYPTTRAWLSAPQMLHPFAVYRRWLKRFGRPATYASSGESFAVGTGSRV